MRSIIKPEKIPENLTIVQNSIAEELYQKKEKFKWSNTHYNLPIKDKLKDLYKNKCAFCEVELSDYDTDSLFTIEHYRPKEYYYWLGAEWTNLFPTCGKCNGNKKSEFPLAFDRKRIKKENAPFDDKGKLLLEKCKVDSEDLINEEPLFLHPEIDKPEKYFEFTESGKAIINAKIKEAEKERARKMLDKFINRPSIEEKRKLKIIRYQKRLTDLLIEAVPKLGVNPSENDVRLIFLDFFTDIISQQLHGVEFSRLGYYMIKDFNKFFLDKLENDETRKLMNYAFELFVNIQG